MFIKKFTAWNDYAWGGDSELELLSSVVEKAKAIEEFEFARVRSDDSDEQFQA